MTKLEDLRRKLIEEKYLKKWVTDGDTWIEWDFPKLPFSIGTINGFFGVICSEDGRPNTFENFPKIINGGLEICNCTVYNLDFFPEEIEGDLMFINCKNSWPEDLIRTKCNIKGSVIYVA